MRKDSFHNYPLLTSLSSQHPNGNGNRYDDDEEEEEEEWTTKKKVETVTKKNIEKRLNRQVVLNDGRVIDEADPEVTVDTLEDSQTHEEEDSDHRDTKSFGFNRDWVLAQGKGEDALEERFQRKINTYDVHTNSVTSAAAQNLGELRRDDLDKVLKDGRDVRQLVKRREDASPNAIAIPAREIHRDSWHARKVDREDLHELSRRSAVDGRLRSERRVVKETTEDFDGETPEEGSSEDSTSFDGDGDAYTHRREERFVDYYAGGRPTSEATHLRRGMHVISQDRAQRPLQHHPRRHRDHQHPPRRSSRQPPAITYDGSGGGGGGGGYSDSTVDGKPPPRGGGSRPSSKSRHQSQPSTRSSRPPSSERSYPTTSVKYSTKDVFVGAAARNFHTIERSHRVGKDKASSPRHPTNIGSGKPHHSDSDRSYRSRSMSRSSADYNQPRMASSRDVEHRTTRSDLDPERESRLKRALSFNRGTPSKSLLGSVKSLYATITKGGAKKSGKENWFDNGDSNGLGPVRPPRKHRSTSYLGGSSSSINQQHRSPSRQPRYSQQHRTSYSYSSDPSRSYHSDQNMNTRATKKHSTQSTVSGYFNSLKKRSPRKSHREASPVVHYSNGGAPGDHRPGKGLERRKTVSSYDVSDNRDAPRFEAHRHRESYSGRLFGQEEDGQVESRERPAPDMRKLLLNNVNLSRKMSVNRGGAFVDGGGARSGTVEGI